MIDLTSPIKLFCPVQHYAWGNSGNASWVARLVGMTHSNLPYAELWVGAHAKASTELRIGDKRQKLSDLIFKRPADVLGQDLVRQFGRRLPYLLKVISVRNPLSIQAHPDKILASVLHAKDPKHYQDSNHKPEIALALTRVSLLFGFRPLEEIVHFLRKVPELQKLVVEKLEDASFPLEVTAQEQSAQDQSNSVCQICRILLACDALEIENQSQAIYQRLAEKTKLAQGQLSQEEEWILKLAEEYPEGDIGLFWFYLLNLTHLEPGEALFIPPNVPHSYLTGELIECMASSDNVVRTGLTRKYRDIETLLYMLEYVPQKVERILPVIAPDLINHKRYTVPVEEFFLDEIQGPLAETEFVNSKRPEIVFCLQGNGKISTESGNAKFLAGDAYLISAAVEKFTLSLSAGRVFIVGVPA